jgi:hypothetical protein
MLACRAILGVVCKFRDRIEVCVSGGGGCLVVDRFHLFLGERPGIFDLAVGKSVRNGLIAPV